MEEEELKKIKRSINRAIWFIGIIGYLLGLLTGLLLGNSVKAHAAVYEEVIIDGNYTIPPPVYSATESDYDILCRITEAEATGGTIAQKMNVASCVLARVESSHWPNDIYHVVFQKDQFAPATKDGRYFTVKVTKSTREAVDRVLKFGKTHDCLWFCSNKSYNKKNEKGEYCSYHRLNHTWVFFDGEHHYFYD